MKLYRREITGDIQFIKFMFPTYQIINETNIPMFPIKPAIYYGNLTKKEEFITRYNQTNLDYYVWVPHSDIDLRDRETLMQIAFEQKGSKFPPKYLNWVIDENKMDDETFMDCIKYKLVTGKWKEEYKKEPDDKSFIDLIQSINGSKLNLITKYFTVVKETRPYRLESSLFTFLLRAKNNTYSGKFAKYKRLVQSFGGSKLPKVEKSIKNALDYNVDNYTLRLFILLMSISDSNKQK